MRPLLCRRLFCFRVVALHVYELLLLHLLFYCLTRIWSRLRSSSIAPAFYCLRRICWSVSDRKKNSWKDRRFLKSTEEGVGMLSASGVASRCSLLWWRSSRVVTVRKQSSSTLLSSNNNNNNHYHRRRSNITTVVSASPLLSASMADAAPGAAASDSKSVNVVIKGSVQGVFYRKWTVEAAQKQGLNGWVRNLQDGSVEAVFAGPSKAVNDMIQQCHSGPSDAHVASVDVFPWDHEVPQGFEKRKSS